MEMSGAALDEGCWGGSFLVEDMSGGLVIEKGGGAIVFDGGRLWLVPCPAEWRFLFSARRKITASAVHSIQYRLSIPLFLSLLS